MGAKRPKACIGKFGRLGRAGIFKNGIAGQNPNGAVVGLQSKPLKQGLALFWPSRKHDVQASCSAWYNYVAGCRGADVKIDRLIGILSILLQKETVTAPYLAELFEVSRRTINRDVESLCRAGIPLVTRQGANGGISIMENYKVNQTMLTGAEMRDVLAGLRSLDSVNGTNQYKRLMEKLSAGSSDFFMGDQSVLIDLSSWYKDSLVPKIRLIRNAMDARHEVTFRYFSQSGETLRTIEPYWLVFRWASWYVWGWCRLREDFRLFKLNRMEGLCESETVFSGRSVPVPDLRDERIFTGGISVKALFEPECKWRLVEEFGTECFEVQPDGRLLFHADYTNRENLLTWLMTFRDRVVLLEPKELRRELQNALQRALQNYEEGEGCE